MGKKKINIVEGIKSKKGLIGEFKEFISLGNRGRKGRENMLRQIYTGGYKLPYSFACYILCY